MIASEKKHIKIYQTATSFFLEIDLKLRKINSGEKIINSGNCIYDYVHSFFREDISSNALYIYKRKNCRCFYQIKSTIPYLR